MTLHWQKRQKLVLYQAVLSRSKNFKSYPAAMPRKFLGNDLLGILRGECHRDLRRSSPMAAKEINVSDEKPRQRDEKQPETIRICGREIATITDSRSPHPEACGTILNKLQASLRAHRARHIEHARIRSLRRAAKSRLAWKPAVQPSGKNPACTSNPPLKTPLDMAWGRFKGSIKQHATNVWSLLGVGAGGRSVMVLSTVIMLILSKV